MALKVKMNQLSIAGVMSATLMFHIRYMSTNRVMDHVNSAE
jgi:hypothetical protein